MNIARSFATFMEDEGFGTFGTDLFINGVAEDAPDACFWVVAGGGAALQKNQTNEMLKNYILQVFYRNIDSNDVHEILQSFEETVNSDDCTQLSGYDTIELEATAFPTSQDLGLEDRTIGVVQVTVTIHD